MGFQLPVYHHPDFSALGLDDAPNVRWATVEQDDVIPEGFHNTSMYPEYYKIDGNWKLAASSRMDACIVLRDDGTLHVVTDPLIATSSRVRELRWAAPRTAQRASTFTRTVSKTPLQPMARSARFARVAAARPLTPVTMTTLSSC